MKSALFSPHLNTLEHHFAAKGDGHVNQSILLIAPQTEHIAAVCTVLKSFGMDVSKAENVSDAKAGLTLYSPAFVLLDSSVKDSRQFLLDATRNFCLPIPYIMVAGAPSTSTEHAEWLDLGADICICKPFDVKEILSVMNAVFRREGRNARLGVGKLLPRIKHKELIIDPLHRSVEMRNELVNLTAKEFDILYLLAYRAGDVLTKEEIYESVWNLEYDYTATNISDHISIIRKKLKLDKKDRDYIQTIFGVGYRFARIE